jgi:TetR/AcrR family transcriptional regulator
MLLLSKRRVQMKKSMTASQKPTAEKIMDVAEELFAQRGFDATSLGDITDRVGIRQPGIYKHFENKRELYIAVMARLFDPVLETLSSLPEDAFTPKKAFRLYSQVMVYVAQNPNFPRLTQQAVLAGGWQISLLVDRWLKPFLERVDKLSEVNKRHWRYPHGMRLWVFMGYFNIMLAYVTMAPLYRELYGFDLLSEEALAMQNKFLRSTLRGLLRTAKP